MINEYILSLYLLSLCLFGPLRVPPNPHEEVEKELDDLEQHHERHAQEEAQGASQSGKETINLRWNKIFRPQRVTLQCCLTHRVFLFLSDGLDV